MKAFIVATPLQLFNSLVIMRHFYEGEKCDLFVLNIACDMRPVISRFHAYITWMMYVNTSQG